MFAAKEAVETLPNLTAERIRRLLKERYHLRPECINMEPYHSGWKLVLTSKGFPVYYLRGSEWVDLEYKIQSPEFAHQVVQAQAIEQAVGPQAARVFLVEKLQQVRFAMADRNVDNATAALHLRDLQKCMEIFLPFLQDNVLDL